MSSCFGAIFSQPIGRSFSNCYQELSKIDLKEAYTCTQIGFSHVDKIDALIPGSAFLAGAAGLLYVGYKSSEKKPASLSKKIGIATGVVLLTALGISQIFYHFNMAHCIGSDVRLKQYEAHKDNKILTIITTNPETNKIEYSVVDGEKFGDRDKVLYKIPCAC